MHRRPSSLLDPAWLSKLSVQHGSCVHARRGVQALARSIPADPSLNAFDYKASRYGCSNELMFVYLLNLCLLLLEEMQ
jgi:hypothetical protein